jgi:hypothetical protein
MSGIDGMFPGDVSAVLLLWLSIISHHQSHEEERTQAEG